MKSISIFVAGLLQRPAAWRSRWQNRALKQPGHFWIRFRGRISETISFSRLAALFLGVHATAQAQEGLRPIRGPITPGFWEENAMWAVPAVVVGGLLLLLLGVWIWRRITAEKTLSPWQNYQKEVKEIEELLAEKHTEEVPARLSRVLREYIEASTGIRAPEQTTEEFLAEVLPAPSPPLIPQALDQGRNQKWEGSKPSPESQNPTPPLNPGEGDRRQAVEGSFADLRPFLALIDEAKFARRALGVEDCQELLAQANQFVAANEESKDPS